MKTPKLIISGHPKIILNTKCPKCRSRDIEAVESIKLQCKNCNVKFDQKVKIDIYYSIAKKLELLLAKHNEVLIVGERDTRMLHTNENLIEPQSEKEDDIIHSLLEIKKIKSNQMCWEVSDITNDKDSDYITYCNECGYCINCVTCRGCGKIYVPKKIKLKSGEEKRFTCPSCKSKEYKTTQIKSMSKDCPHCGSNKTRHSKFKATTKQCPFCGSKKIAKPKQIPVYKLIIKRQRRFRTDEEQ